MAVANYDISEIVRGDFIVARMWRQQLFRVTLVTIVDEMFFPLFLCLVAILRQRGRTLLNFRELPYDKQTLHNFFCLGNKSWLEGPT